LTFLKKKDLIRLMITTNTFKLVTREQLKENREYLNMGGLGLVIGTFDLFHAGHLDVLEWAKRSVDTLVIGVKSDALCEGKTIYSEKDRVDILLALPYVDFVCLVDDVKEMIKLVNPEFYLKGPYSNFESLSKEERDGLGLSGSLTGETETKIKFGPLTRDISKKIILEKIRGQK
tara:strand:+ start:4236 stop:4760 length:525 start_codon:yes stop_codon:yes gene_type:complete